MSRPRAAVARGAATLAILLPLASCGTDASPIPAEGIDGMTIPTPSPSPSAFVDHVDDRYFPLPVGATWTYRLRPGGGTVTVTASAGPVVEGITTTATSTVTTTAKGVAGRPVVDLYAQDTRGDVWWFGHDDPSAVAETWRAGSDGVDAGLLVPARVRLGDGYRAALAPGSADERSEVVGTDAAVEVAAGTYRGMLVVDTTDALHGGSVRRFYAAGVGLVEAQSLTGAAYDEELVSHTGG